MRYPCTMHFLVFCCIISAVSGAFLKPFSFSTSMKSLTSSIQKNIEKNDRYAIKKSSTPIQIKNNNVYSTSTLNIGLGTSEENTNESKETEKKELTSDTIVEMIEVTFVNACLQLSKGYVDVLKLFIVSVKTAFQKGLTISYLLERLDSYPIQSANRSLMKEEEQLRSTWMNLVYLILEDLAIPNEYDKTKTTRVDQNIRNKYGVYMQYISDWRKKQNFDDRDAAAMVAELKVEDVIQGCTSNKESTITDAIEKAMLPQNIRVGLLTLTVLEEEKRCLDDKSNNFEDMPPPPPIPGTN